MRNISVCHARNYLTAPESITAPCHRMSRVSGWQVEHLVAKRLRDVRIPPLGPSEYLSPLALFSTEHGFKSQPLAPRHTASRTVSFAAITVMEEVDVKRVTYSKHNQTHINRKCTCEGFRIAEGVVHVASEG